jgi:hypothetical protein
LQWALFWIAGGGGDALARLGPAALGTALVLVPWLMRPAVGREATLALAGLLAVDPVLVGTSRAGDGAAPAALGALVAVACLVRARTTAAEGARTRWRRATAAAVGLLAACGPHAWSALALLGVAVAGAPGGEARRPDRASLGIAGASLVVAATAGLTHWPGLPAVSASLTAWLAHGPWRSGLDVGGLFTSLVLEQPLAVGLGLLGLAAEWRRPGAAPGRRRLTLVAVSGLAVALGRLPLTLLLILAAGRAMGVVSGGAGASDRPPRARSALAVAAVVLLLLALPGLRSALQHTVGGEAVAGIRLLAADVATLCAWQGADPRECPVQVVADPWGDPRLAWYLRDLPRLRWVLGPSRDLDDPVAPLAVISPDGARWRLPDGYAGSPYRLGRGATDRDRVILWAARRPAGDLR